MLWSHNLWPNAATPHLPSPSTRLPGAHAPPRPPCPPAAVFRCFGEVAELPLLAVRPELQGRNGLGRLLLAAVEHVLLAAGAKVKRVALACKSCGRAC